MWHGMLWVWLDPESLQILHLLDPNRRAVPHFPDLEHARVAPSRMQLPLPLQLPGLEEDASVPGRQVLLDEDVFEAVFRERAAAGGFDVLRSFLFHHTMSRLAKVVNLTISGRGAGGCAAARLPGPVAEAAAAELSRGRPILWALSMSHFSSFTPIVFAISATSCIGFSRSVSGRPVKLRQFFDCTAPAQRDAPPAPR